MRCEGDCSGPELRPRHHFISLATRQAADLKHQAQAPQRGFRETTNHIRTFIFLKRPVLCQGENKTEITNYNDRCVIAFLSSIILSSYIINTNAIYRVITTTELAGVRGRPASARRPSRRSGCRCCCSSAADPRHQAQAPQRRFRETTNHITASL